MLLCGHPVRRRSAFTLIELLTVVAIIALLISILLPSLSRARDQAKAAKIKGLLSALDKGLVMFQNDFGYYPDSRRREDPVTDWSAGGVDVTSENTLSGAHWLARAMVGFDFGGMNSEAKELADGSVTDNQIAFNDLKALERKPVYLDGEVFFKDNNASAGLNTGGIGDFVPTGRPVVMDDAFKSPILYYRANERAGEPFCLDGLGTNDPGTASDRLGIYRHQDNALITGNGGTIKGWDFGMTGRFHQIGPFGTYDSDDPEATHTIPDGYTNTFVHYLHSKSAHKTGNRIKPYNADTCILMSAGKDGIFGTDDDITNFNPGQ